jgi:seryl-tRNA synthetase
VFTVEALNKVILPYNIQFYSITKLTVFQEFKAIYLHSVFILSIIALIFNSRNIKMIDLNLIRENPQLVKENIKKKFQDYKLPFVDEVLTLDKKKRELQQEGDNLRAQRNVLAKQIGALMKEGKKQEAEEAKATSKANNERIAAIEAETAEVEAQLKKDMMAIPNIIADDVPLGKDDSFNVQGKVFLKHEEKPFDVPYHLDILESLNGIDLDSARRTSGNGFYYLTGDIARLHSAVLSYARDFMIDKGFTYCIPPYMIRSDVVSGVMSFEEMDGMMYKIEGEDLYLIGTSEHSMIGRFMGQIIPENTLPQTLTSYSPCFRKEKGAHGLEERGIYRIHQFEKQEMIVLCKPEESDEWYEKLWNYTVELFTSMEIPVRQLICCSGDLADLKYKSCDIEAWSPRQKKYFEVGSCSNLTDAQARRLGIRYKSSSGKNEFVHTLNNTVVAPPRMLIAFLENHLQADGSVYVPPVLRPYMGGKEKLTPKK